MISRLNKMRILVTGSAGFIGSFLSKALSEKGAEVYGIDTINDYYDIELKKSRLKECGIHRYEYNQECSSHCYSNYVFNRIDLCDKKALENIFRQQHFDTVINLAAQAGVRYSLSQPETYINSNIVGFLNLLECCRHYSCPRLIFASSSSVYGNDAKIPFCESEQADHPVSIYAATKKTDELMAYTYSYLYKLQTIGLRFFTVYGPSGRPDMAPMLFAGAISRNEPINIFNHGNLSRDFTYIDDIIAGITKITETPGIVREDHPGVPAVIYNIGHGSPVYLMDFIRLLEEYLGKEARKNFVEMQAGDVYQTWADTSKLKEDYGYVPQTVLEEGIRHFSVWYKSFISV